MIIKAFLICMAHNINFFILHVSIKHDGRSFFVLGVSHTWTAPAQKLLSFCAIFSFSVGMHVIYQVRTIFWHNRWSGAVPHVSNRMKHSNLQKSGKTHSVLGCAGCVGERISVRCHQVTSKVPKTVKNLCVLQFCSWDGSFRHGEMKIWLCLYFQHVTRYIGTTLWKKADKKCKDQKKSIFLAKGALVGKSIFQIQRINAVRGRCSSSGVLRHIPSHFTRSVRRRIVL